MSPKKDAISARFEIEAEMAQAVAAITQEKFVVELQAAATDKTEKASGSSVFLLFFFYLSCIAISLLYSGRYTHDCTESLPWVNKQNATNIVMARLKGMESEYEAALLSEKWVTLLSEQNMTVEVIKGEEGARSIFVRLTSIYEVKPDKLYKRFKFENYDATMKSADPSYESSSLLFSPETKFFFPSNGINLVKQVRSSLFLFSCLFRVYFRMSIQSLFFINI